MMKTFKVVLSVVILLSLSACAPLMGNRITTVITPTNTYKVDAPSNEITTFKGEGVEITTDRKDTRPGPLDKILGIVELSLAKEVMKTD